jgi:hypothetical protein
MIDIDWKKFVGGLAPVLGLALGGPLAQSAVKVLASAVLGDDTASEADVAAAITGGQLSGEQIVAIKTAEQAFAVRMHELDVDLVKINQSAEDAMLRDVQDARARQVATKDYMPQIIFFLFLAIYVAEVAMFFFGRMPTDEYVRALMTRAFGTVEAGVVGAVAYFIGSSRGSKNSGDAIRKIAEQAGGRAG